MILAQFCLVTKCGWSISDKSIVISSQGKISFCSGLKFVQLKSPLNHTHWRNFLSFAQGLADPSYQLSRFHLICHFNRFKVPWPFPDPDQSKLNFARWEVEDQESLLWNIHLSYQPRFPSNFANPTHILIEGRMRQRIAINFTLKWTEMLSIAVRPGESWVQFIAGYCIVQKWPYITKRSLWDSFVLKSQCSAPNSTQFEHTRPS